jgi:hypothetical protein
MYIFDNKNIMMNKGTENEQKFGGECRTKKTQEKQRLIYGKMQKGSRSTVPSKINATK